MRSTIGMLVLGVVLMGCQLGRLTGSEARQALEETQLAQQAAALTAASVEVSTEFTIGSAVEEAAMEVRDFVHSQLPCAATTVEGRTVSIEYGAEPGACEFKGREFSGSHTIEVERTDMHDVLVHHRWDDFSSVNNLTNERIGLQGTADVTWDFDDRTRRIQHELTWTRQSDGRMGVGGGDRLQQPLAGGVLEGIQIDGQRTWDGDAGRWSLDIRDVQVRWQDPVPQAGRYDLDTPFDKSVAVEFNRIDDTTIAVTIEGPRRSFTFNVNQLGVATDAD